MKYYFAPMEGITGYVFRNAYSSHFPNMDKYFAAFISPNGARKMNSKEVNDILPEHNKGMHLVPQILTNNWEAFVKTARELKEYGYQEVNLNLGCPSPTVVTKKKGSGFLAYPEELNAFLEAVFQALPDMKISLKTRLGKEEPEEFYRLLEIYNQYPIEELIIHPRVQKDMYANHPNLEMFREATKLSRHKICYNGDLFTPKSLKKFQEAFPETKTVMLGRGILKNPGILKEIKTGEKAEKEELRSFHDQILTEYRKVLYGDKTVLFKMKEIWSYMHPLFTNSEKYWKKIKKAQKISDYEITVASLFREQEIVPVS